MIFTGEYINFNKSGIYKILNTVTGDFYIGSEFGVSASTISHINCGKKWNNIQNSVPLSKQLNSPR